MIKLAVGLPCYGLKIDYCHARMWSRYGHALCANEEQFTEVMFGGVDANPVGDTRNLIMEGALAAEADWLLMVDADTYVDDDDAGFNTLRMIKTGHQRNAAIIGAAVRGRGGEGHERMVWRKNGDRYPMVPEREYAGELAICDRLATAFFAVNLNWVRSNMPDPPWFIHTRREKNTRTFGEDISFCDAVRERGGEILVDGRFFPKHVMIGSRL